MRKIFITAGHRGEGTGAAGLIDEGKETILLRDDIADILRNKGVEVITDDNEDNLNSVVGKINKDCEVTDICVDIHFNAFNGSAHGTEVLHQNYPTNTEIELAEDMLNATTVTLGTKNRGVKKEGQARHGKLAMLSSVKCNSVLAEVCFCDNQEDCDKYNENREELVYAYAETLFRFANM